MIEYPKPQELQSLDLKKYKRIVCVFGSRDWNDRKYFHEKILDFLSDIEEPVLFVSGAASSGADDLIIRWCAKFRYPCLSIPADWEANSRAAGFIRNTKMAHIVTDGICFYDGASRGTAHMLEECEKLNKPVRTFYIKQKHNNEDHQKSTLVI